MSVLLYLSLCFSLVLGLEENTEVLTINFENVRFAEGTISVGFYTNKESWIKRKPAFEMNIPNLKWWMIKSRQVIIA